MKKDSLALQCVLKQKVLISIANLNFSRKKITQLVIHFDDMHYEQSDYI